MNKPYVFAKLNSRNEFRVTFTASLLDTSIESNLKIDTGAVRSLIPLRTLRFFDNCLNNTTLSEEDFYINLKSTYLDSGVKYGFMKGIERVKYEKDTPLIDRKDIVFSKKLTNLVVCDYIIPYDFDVSISCDTDGNILLGMDILSLFEFHCGYSNKLNNFIFIGVLKSQEDKSDYYRALESHFRIVTNCKDLLYYDFLDDEKRKNEASGFFKWVSQKFGGNNGKDK